MLVTKAVTRHGTDCPGFDPDRNRQAYISHPSKLHCYFSTREEHMAHVASPKKKCNNLAGELTAMSWVGGKNISTLLLRVFQRDLKQDSALPSVGFWNKCCVCLQVRGSILFHLFNGISRLVSKSGGR